MISDSDTSSVQQIVNNVLYLKKHTRNINVVPHFGDGHETEILSAFIMWWSQQRCT